jgi:hypothetical protein
VGELDSGQLLELLAYEMPAGAETLRGICQAVCLAVGDELLHRGHRQSRPGDDDVGDRQHQRYRLQVLHGIVADLDDVRQDRKRRVVAHDQGIAVRPRFRDGIGGNDPITAETVFDDSRVPVLGEPLRDDAGGEVAEAAGRNSDNDLNRLRRRKLCHRRPRRKVDAAGEQRNCEPASRTTSYPDHPACSMCPMWIETMRAPLDIIDPG